jgi:hypothetical protein
MVPWWCRTETDAWEAQVDKWLTEEFVAAHSDASTRRRMMGGPAHHQGSIPLAEYQRRWVCSFNFYSKCQLRMIYNHLAFFVAEDDS